MTTKSMIAAAFATVLSATALGQAASAATSDGQQRWNGQQRTGGQGASTTRRGTATNQRGGATVTAPVVVTRPAAVVVRRVVQPVREPVRVTERDDNHGYDRGRRDDDGHRTYRSADRRDGRWNDGRGYHDGDTFRQHRRHRCHWWRRWW
ncbi:MAG: hypothetical protein ABL897_14005 [Hyphomicrobium sp.]